MPIDAVFRDQSGREFIEFVPVDLLLGPYMKDLQSSAAAVDNVVTSEGESLPHDCSHKFVAERCKLILNSCA